MSADTKDTQPKRRRWLRWLLGGVLLLVVFITLAPSLLGSRWVVGPLLDRLLKDDLSVNIADTRVGWLQPLTIEQFEIFEPGGEPLVEVEAVRGDRSLIDLLGDPGDWGSLQIDSPTIHLSQLDEGTNFRKLIQALRPPQERERRRPHADVVVNVHNPRLMVSDQGVSRPLVDQSLGDLQLVYSAKAGPPQVTLPAATLLDHAELTPELFAYGLKYVIPVLSASTAIDGKISLSTTGVSIPLEEPLDAKALGQLTIHDVTVEATSPILLKVAEVVSTVFKVDAPTRVRLVDESEINFEVIDQGVHHEGVKFGLPELDSELVLATNGWVYFDGRLDLRLEIPVPVGVLADSEGIALETTAPEEEDPDKRLDVRLVTIPIGGTLQEPKIQWAQVKTELFDGNWLEIAKTAGQQFRKFRERRQAARAAAAEERANEDLDDTEPGSDPEPGSDLEPGSDPEPGNDPGNAESNEAETRPGLLRRLRDRLRNRDDV